MNNNLIVNPLFASKQIIVLGSVPTGQPESGQVFYWTTLENDHLYANYRVRGEVTDRKYIIDNVSLSDVNAKISVIDYDETTHSLEYSTGEDDYNVALTGLVYTGSFSTTTDLLTLTLTGGETITTSIPLSGKVDKVAGYGLSKNDFTDALLTKLNGISENANNYSLPTASSGTKGGIKVGDYVYVSNEVLNGYSVSAGNGITVNTDNTNHVFTVTLNTNYSSEKTYAANEIVVDNNKVYVSLQGSNTGNTPSTETAYWKEIGKYTQGTGINISGANAISVDSTVVALKTDKLQGKINVVKDSGNSTETVPGIEGVYFPNATVSKDNSTNVATITIPSAI